jgi:hypothetical protein
LFALEAAELSDDLVSGKIKIVPGHIVGGFVQALKGGSDTYNETKLQDMSTCKSLWRLHATIEFFVQDFADQCFEALRVSSVENGGLVKFPGEGIQFHYEVNLLSPVEKGRLQRAFYRFEIYRKLYCNITETNVRDGGGRDEEDQAEVLSRLFTAWDCEELTCVYQYLLAKMEDLFDDIEDHFVETVLSMADPERAMNEQLSRSKDRREFSFEVSKWKEHSKRLCETSDLLPLHSHGFEFFELETKRHQHLEYMHYFVVRGLPFVRRLLELNLNDQMSLATSNPPYYNAFIDKVMQEGYAGNKILRRTRQHS